MHSNYRCLVIALLYFTISAGSLHAAEPTVEALIDELQKVESLSFGYSATFSAYDFRPHEGAQNDSFLFGGASPISSDALKQIVLQGSEAIPTLIKHIDDKRHVKMEVVKGLQWMSHDDEYDFNHRTAKEKPLGVNRRTDYGRQEPQEHSVTVGDLCFVALGHIVNRRFHVARYQPSGGCVVSSPTYSERLKAAIVKEWGTLSRERHLESLRSDFLQPDYPWRRIDAYHRLSFYYPDAVESLVLELLDTPTYDVEQITTFCETKLYKAKDPAERRRLVDEFVAQHGPASADGIQEQLFEDLWRNEESTHFNSDGTESPRGTGRQPKYSLLLTELFKFPTTVNSSDSHFTKYDSKYDRWEFIAGLTQDQSLAVAEQVRKLLEQSDRKDADEIFACLRCLANRGYADVLLSELQRVNIASDKSKPGDVKILRAIATSRDRKVLGKLLDILRTTTQADYFVAILPAIDESHSPVVLESARILIEKQPLAADRLLRLIRASNSADAKSIFQAYLASKDPQCIAITCNVFWNQDPWSLELLTPFLDDQRELSDFDKPTRVCDRVADTICNYVKVIRFDSDRSREHKDKIIAKLKTYIDKMSQSKKPSL